MLPVDAFKGYKGYFIFYSLSNGQETSLFQERRNVVPSSNNFLVKKKTDVRFLIFLQFFDKTFRKIIEWSIAV
jgi:hypothetical protein